MRTKQRASVRGSARKVWAAAFAAALALAAAAPPSLAQGGRGRSVRGTTSRGNVRTGQPATDGQRAFGPQLLREHIPPILFMDGSLTVRADRFGPRASSGNANRPHRYRRGGFNQMRRVVVTAFTEDGIPHYYPWEMQGSASLRVRIFLERWDPKLNAYVPVHATEPQIEVKGSHEIDIHEDMLDSGANEDCQPVPGSVLECKFEHPGFGGVHFRIRDVHIHRGNSPNYEYPAWPANKHQVLIHFYYHHPHQ